MITLEVNNTVEIKNILHSLKIYLVKRVSISIITMLGIMVFIWFTSPTSHRIGSFILSISVVVVIYTLYLLIKNALFYIFIKLGIRKYGILKKRGVVKKSDKLGLRDNVVVCEDGTSLKVTHYIKNEDKMNNKNDSEKMVYIINKTVLGLFNVSENAVE